MHSLTNGDFGISIYEQVIASKWDSGQYGSLPNLDGFSTETRSRCWSRSRGGGNC